MTAGPNLAADPLWWSFDDNVVIVPGQPTNHFGPSNLGQALWMAKSALEIIRGQDPVLADAIQNDLVGPGKPISANAFAGNPSEPNHNHLLLNIGQLKAISHPFYAHLQTKASAWLQIQRQNAGTESGGVFPWTDSTVDDNNYGIAVIALNLESIFWDAGDEDGDGIANSVEYQQGTNIFLVDSDGDGIADNMDEEPLIFNGQSGSATTFQLLSAPRP